MKVLPFHIPKTEQTSLHVQVDKDKYFYDILHKHPEIQVTYIVKSKGTLVLTDYLDDFEAGDLFIIGPNQPHMFKNDPEYYEERVDMEAHGISIFFDANIFGQSFLELPENRKLLKFLKNCDYNMRLKKTHSKNTGPLMIKILESSGPQRLLALIELLYQLSSSKSINLLNSSTVQKYQDDREGLRMTRVIDYTTKEYHRDINLTLVASLANMTVTSFCRYFKKRTRKSYIDFLSEVRVRQACKLLQNTDQPISQICFQSGFNNLSNFNRKFKKITGTSPRHFRSLS